MGAQPRHHRRPRADGRNPPAPRRRVSLPLDVEKSWIGTECLQKATRPAFASAAIHRVVLRQSRPLGRRDKVRWPLAGGIAILARRFLDPFCWRCCGRHEIAARVAIVGVSFMLSRPWRVCPRIATGAP